MEISRKASLLFYNIDCSNCSNDYLFLAKFLLCLKQNKFVAKHGTGISDLHCGIQDDGGLLALLPFVISIHKQGSSSHPTSKNSKASSHVATTADGPHLHATVQVRNDSAQLRRATCLLKTVRSCPE
jgi:hypothetical protein